MVKVLLVGGFLFIAATILFLCVFKPSVLYSCYHAIGCN
jgi:hypothetical protein